jgi:hypothetical protein
LNLYGLQQSINHNAAKDRYASLVLIRLKSFYKQRVLKLSLHIQQQQQHSSQLQTTLEQLLQRLFARAQSLSSNCITSTNTNDKDYCSFIKQAIQYTTRQSIALSSSNATTTTTTIDPPSDIVVKLWSDAIQQQFITKRHSLLNVSFFTFLIEHNMIYARSALMQPLIDAINLSQTTTISLLDFQKFVDLLLFDSTKR